MIEKLLPIAIVLLFEGDIEKLDTLTATVTVHLAVSPLVVFAVIIDVPPAIALTVPSAATVATFSLELLHETLLYTASDGVTVAVSFCVEFGARVISVLSRVTAVADTSALQRPSLNTVSGVVSKPPLPLPI